jgi:ribosomal protein S18 acetylase RimI-like enzyme
MTQDEAEALCGLRFGPGWTFYEVRRAGKLAGFVMERDGEMHAWRSPAFTGRWLTRADVQTLLGGVINRYGCATTRVPASNETGQRFVERLGFERMGEHAGVVTYKAVRLQHAKH